MNRQSTRILIVFFIIAAVVTAAIYFEKTGLFIAEPVMRLNVHTTSKISGVLNKDSLIVEFESRMETLSQVLVRIRVDDLILNAIAELESDGQKKLVIIDGHGKVMTLENKEALTTLASLLEHQLDPYRQDVLPHEDLLARMANFLAEAPVGFQLMRYEIRP